MKERFTTIDVFSVLQDLRESLMGMRVANVYDVDHKTYLIKLAKPDVKKVLLFESGCRIHTTEFEWPKSMQPSGFSMKLRKHLRTRRLVAISQLGVDRVIDLQFGSEQAAYHLIIELYDRGNVILTDCDYLILSLLRTRTDADADVRFAVRETFSQDTVKREQPLPSRLQLEQALSVAKKGEQLKHVLNPHFVFGAALLSHCLLGAGIKDTAKIGSGFSLETDMDKVMAALEEADQVFRSLRECQSRGIVIQKREVRPQVVEPPSDGAEEGEEPLMTNVEFHPMLFRQHAACPYKEYPTLSKAVDEFFSTRTSQKQDLKALSVQKTAVKKLENVKRDHLKRIDELQKKQDEDRYKAQLIEYNIDLVERACTVIRSAVANAMDWSDIELLVRDAQARGDPVAMVIHNLKLASNEITLLLREPTGEEEEEGVGVVSKKKKQLKGTRIDIDLGMTAFSNARRYYEHKKSAFNKEQKTVAASEKALKSAEKKTKQTLKDASTIAKIKKARKVHWFEKFFWFISSENFLVIGGRDQQQNEQVVKRYLTEGDLYVHADLHGAPSVVIKNTGGGAVPPRTLTEAGSMAVCYSLAWEARIVTSAWWVHSHQVSKTAPSGEYLTTGSFMIRGRKNFLPPCDLAMGFGFLFKVDETCIPLHLHERKVATDDLSSVASEASSLQVSEEEEEEVLEVEAEQEEEEEEEEEVDSVLLDTTITLSHIGGDTFELKRGISESSTRSLELERERVQREKEEEEEDGGEGGRWEKRHQHLSAKQRRDMKRQAKQEGDQPTAPNPPPAQSRKKQKQQVQQPPAAQQPQVKRGQKAKQKKMKDKYGDQDEEERKLRMKILASGLPSKQQPQQQSQQKGGKKGRKDPNQPTNPKHKYHQKSRGKDQPSTISEVPRRKQLDPQFVTAAPSEGVREEEEGGNLDPSLVAGEQDTVVEDVEAVDGVEEPLTLEEEEEMGKEREKVGEEEVEKEEGEVGEDEEGVESVSVNESVGGGGELAATEGAKDIAPVDLSSPEGASEGTTEGATGGSLERENGPAAQGNDEDSDEEEKKAILADENIQQLDDTEKDQLSVLDSFTGSPVPEDILIYAIPVCAPYTAVTNYKHRVKLVPGTNKRGKAARAALHRFIQSRDSSQREKDLLKSVKDNDLSRYIPGKVKISIPQSQGQKRSHK